jgi:hypothetical protein
MVQKERGKASTLRMKQSNLGKKLLLSAVASVILFFVLMQAMAFFLSRSSDSTIQNIPPEPTPPAAPVAPPVPDPS